MWLLIVRNNDGGNIDVFAFSSRRSAEDALITDVGETFNSPLEPDEWAAVINDAWSPEGMMMEDYDGLVIDVATSWYLREVVQIGDTSYVVKGKANEQA